MWSNDLEGAPPAPTRPGLLAWSALLLLATLLTPFAVWAVVSLAEMLTP